MVRLEFSIEIERTSEEIFDVVGNPENDARWQSAVLSVQKLTPGPIRTGSQYRHSLNILGQKMDAAVEISERQPASSYVLQCVSGPFSFETRVQLRPAKRGTLMDTVVEGRPTGVAHIAAVVLSRRRRGEIDRDLRTLKRLMEAGEL